MKKLMITATLALVLPLCLGAQDAHDVADIIDRILEIWPNSPELLKRLVVEQGDAGTARLVADMQDQSKTADVRVKAMNVLAAIRAPEAIDGILEALNDQALQCSAISAVSQFRDPRSIPLLIPFLDDHKVCGQMVRVRTSSRENEQTDWFMSDGAVAALENITGLSFESSKDLFTIGHRATRPWSDWWLKNESDFRQSPQRFLAPPPREHTSDSHYPCSVDKIAISPDGKNVFSGSRSYDGKVRMWDLATTNQVWATEGHSDSLTGAVFSPDGRTVASSSWDGSIMIWDVATGKRLQVLLSKRGMDSVAFSPDGGILAAADDDGLVSLWNTRDWSPIRELDNGEMTEGIAFSPDGKLLATATFQHVQVWDVASGKVEGSLPVQVGKSPTIFVDEGERQAQLWRMAWNVAFSPDGKFLATGSSAAIQVWAVSSNQEVASAPSDGEVVGLAFSPDGKSIVWGNSNGEIQIWDQVKRKVRRIKNSASTGDIAITPNGQNVLSPDAGTTIRIFDLAARRLSGRLECIK
jgi:DNA-binding beta-propeller fold protein YncE